MATIYKRFEIHASVNQVWTKMPDLSHVYTLFGMLANAELQGDTRVCRTQDGEQLKKLIVSVDPNQKRLVYSITESPFDFEFHCASWQAVPNGDGTIFE